MKGHTEERAIPASLYIHTPLPRADACELVERLALHGVSAQVSYMSDVTVLLTTEGGVIWGYGGMWRWWTGVITPAGKWIYNQASTSDPAAAARLIASHLAERAHRPVPLQRWST